MILQTSPPSFLLSRYISQYIYYQINTSEFKSLKQTFLPYDIPALGFFTGSCMMISNKNKSYPISYSSGQVTSYYMGMITSPYHHLYNENENISALLVVFAPTGFSDLFKMNMAEVTDVVPEFSNLIGSEINSLNEAIANSFDFSEKVKILDHFFLCKHSHKQKDSDQIHEACSKVIQSNGLISMKNLAYCTNMSISKLERHFTYKIGITPKTYAKIKRFHHSLSLINSMKLNSFTEIALECGYYDQNHFIKEFKALTNNTPSSFSCDEYFLFNRLILFSSYYEL